MVSTILSLFLAFSLWVLETQETIKPSISAEKPVEIYSNQLHDNLTAVFSSAIDQAQHSILLIVYSLTDQEIIKILKKKHNEGVSIKVICDAKASPYIDSKLGSKIDVTRRFGPGLMHQKILVVDEQHIWIGSANMTTESLQMHGNIVSKLDSPALAKEIIAKAETLQTEGRSLPLTQKIFDIAGQPIELWFLPDNKNGSLRLKKLIREAEKTVRVAMFTWTRTDLAKEVIAAADRGLTTEVVIDHYSGKGASRYIVELLKNSNVAVRLSRGGPLLHYKFLQIDNTTLVSGSANWTKAAFTQNDDCFIVIHNLTEEQNQKLNALWEVIWAETSLVE